MNKNLEELKKANQGYTEQNAWTKLQIALCYIIPILEGFDKRLAELEKFRVSTLGDYEINETGGVNDIKIGGTDPD
ncbi:hypothetical protein ES695_21340 [Candidatus Atribacteria bacterium 1244-E10-H5-B2]|nr:MAG: hypothetical protein ES695_21340 [Candidatus Atribacteria bacterium 1244-E10-H5-B2]